HPPHGLAPYGKKIATYEMSSSSPSVSPSVQLIGNVKTFPDFVDPPWAATLHWASIAGPRLPMSARLTGICPLEGFGSRDGIWMFAVPLVPDGAVNDAVPTTTSTGIATPCTLKLPATARSPASVTSPRLSTTKFSLNCPS